MLRSQLVLIVVTFLGSLAPAIAQTTAGVRGTVSDGTGAAIAQAKVTVTNSETGLASTVTTDSSGTYSVTLLPVGLYTVTVEAVGFKRFEQSGIRLTTNEVAGLNVTLELGTVFEKVEITSSASLVNTQTTETGTLIETRQIMELPLNSRNVIQLATLTNGVAAERVHQTL